MKMHITAKIEDMKETVKTKKDGEDLPLRAVAQVTLDIPATPEILAKLTGLHQMLLKDQPISVTIECEQALFDLDVRRVEGEAKKLM